MSIEFDKSQKKSTLISFVDFNAIFSAININQDENCLATSNRFHGFSILAYSSGWGRGQIFLLGGTVTL